MKALQHEEREMGGQKEEERWDLWEHGDDAVAEAAQDFGLRTGPAVIWPNGFDSANPEHAAVLLRWVTQLHLL